MTPTVCWKFPSTSLLVFLSVFKTRSGVYGFDESFFAHETISFSSIISLIISIGFFKY